MYDGRDLTKIFASEIAKFPSPWHWIQDRINNRNYKGLNNCDFIPMTVESKDYEMQIMGINTYKKTTDQELDDHIDFISRDCYLQPVQWHTTDNNNGTASQEYPYLASNVKRFLDQLYEKLPANVKSLIVEKRTLLEKRYSASGALKESNGWGWADIGKLWLPTEYEVCGSTDWGTKGYGSGQAVQYPIFSNSWKNRVKNTPISSGLYSWWLLSVAGDSSNAACIVTYDGHVSAWPTTATPCVPLCFRLCRQN